MSEKLSAMTALPTPLEAGDIFYVVRGSNYYKGSFSDLPAGGTGTVTSVGVSVGSSLFTIASSPVTTSGIIALTPSQSGFKTFLDYKEEEINGTATEDATLTGAESIDLETDVDAYYTLAGNTTISVTNTPSADESFVRTWTIKSTATETLTLPAGWVVIGEYVADGSENFLNIKFSNYTTAGAKVVCYINQDD